VVLAPQPLVLLREGEDETGCEEEEVVAVEERGLADIDGGLFELTVLVLEEDDEGDEDEGEEEERRGRIGVFVDEAVHEQ
jgi:hypothetical protein